MGKGIWFIVGSGLGLSVSQNFDHRVCWNTGKFLGHTQLVFSYPSRLKDTREIERILKQYLD